MKGLGRLFLKIGLNRLIKLIEKVVAKDAYEQAAIFLAHLLYKISDVLMDEIKGKEVNQEQLRKLLIEEAPNAIRNFMDVLAEATLGKVKKDRARSILALAYTILERVALILTDEDPDNARQLDELFDQLSPKILAKLKLDGDV